MQKIALIVAYFGKVPSFYKAWEATAVANPTIDFYIFTDDTSIIPQKNIFIKYTSFSEFKALIQEKFEFEIALELPYKLCDYRPAYGYIFQDLLKEYDWWGYCDMDMVFGNIRKFFNDSILLKYERCQNLGHICIYKNCEKINTLFKYHEGDYPALNYDDVYTTNESMYFDEARGMYTKCIINDIEFYVEESFRDPREGERKFIKNDYKNNYVVFWKDGQLFCTEKNGKSVELLYAHFFKRKFDVDSFSGKINTIKIMPRSVIFNDDVTEKDFDKSEIVFYKYLYKAKNAYKSIKRYGLKRTFERQKWSKDHNIYIDSLK